VIAGERSPNGVFNAKSKSEGTIEDHRAIALHVRELIREYVFEQPAVSVFHLNLRFPWLRVMRLNSGSLDLKLVTGCTVVVPMVWAGRRAAPAKSPLNHCQGSAPRKTAVRSVRLCLVKAGFDPFATCGAPRSSAADLK
jgi:hypothetical protein